MYSKYVNSVYHESIEKTLPSILFLLIPYIGVKWELVIIQNKYEFAIKNCGLLNESHTKVFQMTTLPLLRVFNC